MKKGKEMATPLSMDLKRMIEENVHLRGKILELEALVDMNSDDGSRVIAMKEKLSAGYEAERLVGEFERWMIDDDLKQKLEHILTVLEIYGDEVEVISTSNNTFVIDGKMDAFVRKLNASGEMGKAVNEEEKKVMRAILRWKGAIAKKEESSPGSSEEEKLAKRVVSNEEKMLLWMSFLRKSVERSRPRKYELEGSSVKAYRLAYERTAVQRAVLAKFARKVALKKAADNSVRKAYETAVRGVASEAVIEIKAAVETARLATETVVAEAVRKAIEEAALKKEVEDLTRLSGEAAIVVSAEGEASENGEESSPANEVEGEEKPETKEVPDAACTEQLKSQDNLQATCEVGEPVRGVPDDPELPVLCHLGGEVVTATVQDLEKEDINKSLALACAIYIMGIGVYEEAGVSKNIAMIPVVGSDEKTTQGDGMYSEATYGESHKERVIDDHDPVNAEVGPHLLLPTEEQRSHDSGGKVVRVFEDNQGQGLDEKACYEIKIKSYDDTELTIATAATLALMAYVSSWAMAVAIKTEADSRVSAVVDMVNYVDRDGCSQGVPAEVEDVYMNTEGLRELGNEMSIKSVAVMTDAVKKESVDEPAPRLVFNAIHAKAADLEGLEVSEAVAGVKLFTMADKVPPDKDGLDKTLKDTGGDDAKEPNPEANVVKKESLVEESLNELDAHGSDEELIPRVQPTMEKKESSDYEVGVIMHFPVAGNNDAGKKTRTFPMVGKEEELGGKPQAPSQPAGVASRIILSGDGFPSGGERVSNQEANVADKKLVGNGGMMWLPKIDVVSVQIPQPQFESTCRGRTGEDMPRCKDQVRDLENFENFTEKSADIEESVVTFGKEIDDKIISEEYAQWSVMEEKKKDLREDLPIDCKANPEVAAIKKASLDTSAGAVTAATTKITNNEGLEKVEIKTSPGKFLQAEGHHFVNEVPEEPVKGVPEKVWKNICGIDDEAVLPESPHDCDNFWDASLGQEVMSVMPVPKGGKDGLRTILFPVDGYLVQADGMIPLYLKAGVVTILFPLDGSTNRGSGDQDLASDVPDKQGQEVPDGILAIFRAIWDPGTDPACAEEKDIMAPPTENYRYYQFGISNTPEFKVSAEVEKVTRATPEKPLFPDQELRQHVSEVRCQEGHDEDCKGKKTTARLLAEGSLVLRMFVASQIAVEQALKENPGGYSQSADKPAGGTSGIILSSAGFPSGSLKDTGGRGKNLFAQVVQVKDRNFNCWDHSEVMGKYNLIVKEKQAMQVGEVLVSPHQEEKNFTKDVSAIDELFTNMMVEQFLRA